MKVYEVFRTDDYVEYDEGVIIESIGLCKSRSMAADTAIDAASSKYHALCEEYRDDEGVRIEISDKDPFYTATVTLLVRYDVEDPFEPVEAFMYNIKERELI